MTLADLGILVFGCSAVWLVGRKERWRRWGYVCGLCSQPFWLWTAWAHGQWGILVLSAWYTYAWAQGAWNHWRETHDLASPAANARAEQS